jgi:hypothetical protein
VFAILAELIQWRVAKLDEYFAAAKPGRGHVGLLDEFDLDSNRLRGYFKEAVPKQEMERKYSTNKVTNTTVPM